METADLVVFLRLDLLSRPLYGAWIEILEMLTALLSGGAVLHASAWIEIVKWKRPIMSVPVALHMSAWIEISKIMSDKRDLSVALHASAWIEIIGGSGECLESHPVWVRELKYSQANGKG